MDTDKSASIVIIEWDGGRPPTTWYNRLAALGYKVRGSKDDSVITRRQHHQNNGVIAQEGAIICESKSEARGLGHLAYQLGAKAVMVGNFEVTDLDMTNQDVAALQRIDGVLGKRGKPGPEKDYVVTCMDEMRTYGHHGKPPVACPHCGSFKITAREGAQTHFTDTGHADLWETWTASRFQTGQFEEPVLDGTDEFATLPQTQTILGAADKAAAARLTASVLYSQINQLIAQSMISRAEALRILDLGFAILEANKAERQEKRLKGLTKYFERGGSAAGVLVMVDPEQVDLIDLAGDHQQALYWGVALNKA